MLTITLSPERLDKAAVTLAGMVRDTVCDTPAIVVGIRTGGESIAAMIAKQLGTDNIGYINAARPGHGIRKMLSPLLRLLPTTITDRLRTLESRILRHHGSAGRSVSVELSTGIKTMLENMTDPLILVVDDAVDSGATMHAAYDELKHLFPHARLLSAVITVTTPAPIKIPDVALYRDTLVRFPWSADYH